METQVDILNDLQALPVKRRDLLPWWMKIFCWLFMLFGVGAIACLILGIFGFSTGLAIYGLESTQSFSPIGATVICVGLLKGFTAFSLWFEKDYAITLGRIDAIVGIAICTISMIALPMLGYIHFSFRIELLLLIPYLIKLNKIAPDWNH